MKSKFLLAILASASCSAYLWSDPIGNFAQTNLVSNLPGVAAVTDPNLVNPWGVAASPAGPFWVSDNGSGLTTLYNTAGAPQSLVVTIPDAGASAPTGQVFNSSGRFNGDNFLFATENGTIAGWRGALGTKAETLFDNSSSGAVYKGLALATTGQGTYLYAANFHSGSIDVFPGNGAPALTGKFADPNLPAGYAPFNIQNLGGQIYVTYAKQDAAAHDDIAGAGNGFVSVFDVNGNFVKRVASNGALNSPWGLALAPAGFGAVGGDLLVGNFGDGTINAFNVNGAFAGTLSGANGNPLASNGLWALTFGNGGKGGDANSLYITAGLNNEADGLFARVDAVPEPSTFGLLGISFMALMVWLRRNRQQA